MAPISRRGWRARARAWSSGDTRTAVERLKAAAADLQEKGKDADALRLLTEAAQFDPGDIELRRLLVQAYMARGDFEAACQFATSAAELRGVAEELFRQGREDEGINVLSKRRRGRSRGQRHPRAAREAARCARRHGGRSRTC